jgi:glutathione S-transferase
MDWPAVKASMPLGQMPLLEIEEAGGDKLAVPQSLAILRYLGKLGGLYPSDPFEAIQVDTMIDTITEMSLPIEMTVQGSVKWMIGDEPWTKEQVLEIRKRISTDAKNGLPFKLSFFEKKLDSNGTGWLVGDKVTIADLLLHRIATWLSSGMLDGFSTDVLDGYSLVKAHGDKIEAIPEVISWRKSHPTPYTDFDFVPPESS